MFKNLTIWYRYNIRDTTFCFRILHCAQQTKEELQSGSNLRLYIAEGAFRVIGTLTGGSRREKDKTPFDSKTKTKKNLSSFSHKNNFASFPLAMSHFFIVIIFFTKPL